jgi:hypothetical protein
MALIRGFNGLQPCPVCHVPKNQLHDFGQSWRPRTGLETQKIIADSKKLRAVAGEELLKSNGLRPIDVCQFLIEFTTILSPFLECIYERCIFRPS